MSGRREKGWTATPACCLPGTGRELPYVRSQEGGPRCLALKAGSIAEVEAAYQDGYRHRSAEWPGADSYFCRGSPCPAGPAGREVTVEPPSLRRAVRPHWAEIKPLF